MVKKKLSSVQETWFQSLGQEDPLEREWLPTPVFFPREFPWTEDPGRLQSIGSYRVRWHFPKLPFSLRITHHQNK